MKTNHCIPALLCTLAMTACGPGQKDPVVNGPEPVDETFFKAFSAQNPYVEVLHDPDQDRIYVLERQSTGRIISYDYTAHRILRKTPKPFFINGYELALGTHNGQRELYLGHDKQIHIYAADSLALIDSIQLYQPAEYPFVTSIDARSGFLFVGTCTASDTDGSQVFSRQTKQRLSQAPYGDNCTRLRSFIADSLQGTMGCISVGYATSNPRLIRDTYDAAGQLLENLVEFVPQASSSLHLLKLCPQAGYFISNEEGNIFSLSDLSFLGSLQGAYNDILINADGSLLYAVTQNKSIEVIRYPSLEKNKVIALPETAVRVFFDDNQLIVVYLLPAASGTDIYVSRLDL